MNDSRYPFYFAVEHMAKLCPTFVSPPTAKKALARYAVELGLDEAMVARTLADAYLANKPTHHDQKLGEELARLLPQ